MVDLMYTLCNRYRWFTCGTNEQYNRLFDMVRSGRRTRDLALVISICSEGWTEEAIYKELCRAGFKRN